MARIVKTQTDALLSDAVLTANRVILRLPLSVAASHSDLSPIQQASVSSIAPSS